MKALHSLLAALMVAGAGLAQAGSLADVTIVSRSTGERLQTWRHNGRLYVAGRPGDRYAIELRNNSRGRLLAVLSVDGVNAITGETAAGDQSGYVLGPWQRTEVLGWRKSMDDVAAFYFTALPDSYAARTGRPDNVGVIGVAVFREYVEPPRVQMLPAPAAAPFTPAGPLARSPAAESKAESSADYAGETRSRSAERLGTGHGERLASSIDYVDFRRASDRPAMTMTVYYDSYANLVAQGVIPGPRRPQAFPGGFVPDPA